jgi:hypothetical protein
MRDSAGFGEQSWAYRPLASNHIKTEARMILGEALPASGQKTTFSNGRRHQHGTS